ncbi:MAG: DUF2135 domain-containing protein [bacterium]|nr:DUF2135 domain-containing protein [bacterium]
MELILKRIRTYFVVLFMSLLTTSLLWAESPGAGKTLPEMTADIGGKTGTMVLSQLDVDVKINGFIAETKMTMTFYNPHNRDLEGQLYFPLPEGATVSGYALDIKGQMVEGVVVEKERGRVVFEKIVRRKIDPGLVEWGEGNNFKTRVYPMWKKGCRTISVRYLSETIYKNKQTLYHLPLNYGRKVDKFSMRIEVIKAPYKPEIQSGGPDDFSFIQCRDSYVANTIGKNVLLDKEIIIRLPGKEKQPLKVEKSSDGYYYFCLRDTDTGWKKNRNTHSIKPKRITVLWDASSSMGRYPHQRELNLLRSYIAGLKQTVSVRLVFFRHRKSKPKTFHIAKGNSDALIDEIKNVAYDGGTCMASISPSNNPETPDIYLLFSDGNSNFGKEKPVGFKAPVYIFSGASTANDPLLRGLAAQTGGSYFNLNGMTEKNILEAVGHSPYSFISASYRSGTISETYPQTPQPVRDSFTLAGKLTTDKTQITLNYGVKGKILKKITFTVSRKQATKGEGLRTFWAQQKLAELMIFCEKNRKELLRTGKRFGLVTPGTSLIVLESLAQYIQYEIPPPTSLPHMRDEFFRSVPWKKNKPNSNKTEKLEEVIYKWNQRVAWWNKKNFTLSKESIKSVVKVKRRERFLTELGRMGVFIDKSSVVGHLLGLKPPAPPLPIPPPPAARRSGPRPKRKELSPARLIHPIFIPGIENEAANTPPGVIFLKKGNPSAPYLAKLKNAAPSRVFQEYMKQKKEYGNSLDFYLACADYFSQRGQKSIGLQVLSNIAEMELENVALLRVLGHRMAQLGYLEFSAAVFKKVLILKSQEPQSYRDLALVLARLKKYKKAVKLLYHIITHYWDRFDGIETVVLMEMNNIIARAKAKGITGFGVDSRLIKRLDVDLRIVLTWNTGVTDMNLRITDPLMEKHDYLRKLSTIGGKLSGNVEEGYGPEEYVVKKAPEGKYKIYVNTRGRWPRAPITLQVDIFTDYGRKNEARKSITLSLTGGNNNIYVGEINVRTSVSDDS